MEGVAMPKVKEEAPDFELQSDDGRKVKLSDFRGHKVVLYFYPKDDTPGCTKEACGFRDAFAEYAARGVEVLGVSPDSVASHGKFKTKYELPFTLLADPSHAVAEAYGVWKQKTNYGRTYMGIERTTFVIDEDGRISRVFPRVRAEGHAEQILEEL
jgi:thioredoxin-dependent peroxiredoxin